MDQSVEYINMCRKATEIQEAWEPNYFDNIYIIPEWHKEIDRVEDVLQCNFVFWEGKTAVLLNPKLIVTDEGRWTPKGKIFWLPRQDQLQGMVDFSYIDRDGIPYLEQFFDTDDPVSWEMFWLIFVMHELYQKKWDGSDWVSIP